MEWASKMETAAIRAEIAALDRTIDTFEAGDREGSGSPGEGLYERHEELTTELKRRKE